MTLKRLDYNHHEYIEIKVPSDWNVRGYCDDLTEIINCACCGKEIQFGNSYTSQEIHNYAGIGYCVCSNCHKVEMNRMLKYRCPEKRV